MMEETPLKAKDLILASFSSRVAVISSAAAESQIKQHNLNFTQLVQPFAKLSTEASWQDPNGLLIWPKDISLTLVDISSWKKQEVDAQRNRRLLTNVVGQNPPPLSTTESAEIESSNGNGGCKTVELNGKSLDYQVQVPVRTSWYEVWRKTFLKLQSEVTGNQHEFLNHFVACLLVISSSEVKSSEDVANIVGKLSKIQQQHQYDHPNTWMLPSVLKYYLIIQDKSVNEQESEQVYQNFRSMYGGNFCHMLKLVVEEPSDSEILVPNPWKILLDQEDSLNYSKREEVDGKVPVDEVENIVHSDLLHPLSPDNEKPPSVISQNGDISNGLKSPVNMELGTSLTIQDVRRIQVVVNEFISKALLPYMERQCRNLNESIVNRRGMSKSFFSATKRLFGTSAKSAPSVVYATESVEVLSRKLGDIYFLYGHYGGAYQLYHQLKKDFYGDAAWLYYSSALELAAISHFMMSQSEPPLAVARAFPVHYVNDAIGHYIDQCRMVDAATRCAVICTECLKHLENNAEAAAIFIRMTSEDCDLRSALMLEQAANSFLEMNSPRKYALHCVLAGYRYAKAGLKSHSLNCYRQGHQIYNGKGWRYAEDHVNFTIARLQNILQIPEGITKHLLATLVAPSPQSSQQIQIFYKEFLSTMANLNTASNSVCEFFIPQIQFVDMQLRIAVTGLPVGEFSCTDCGDGGASSTSWDKLEQNVVRECIKPVIKFKPTRLVFSRHLDNTVHPIVPCDEQFFIELPFYNPLKIPLSLRNITLKFDYADLVEVTLVPSLELEPEESKSLRFSVVSHHVGMIVLEAVNYELEFSGNLVSFQQTVVLRGPRLNITKAERFGRLYAKDLRNKIVIINKLPLLQANVEGLPNTLFHTQIENFNIVLSDNSKSTPDMTVSQVIITMDNMEGVLQVLPEQNAGPSSPFSKTNGKNFTRLKCEKTESPTKIPCVFKAPHTGETAVLDILLVYEILHNDDASKKAHRVIRMSIQIPLSPAVHLEYSSLKMLDCINYLGLLRLYNLTVDYSVVVSKIFFTPSDIQVTELCSSSLPEIKTEDEGIMKMNKNESRNIVLKFQDQDNSLKNNPRLTINVAWQIAKSTSEYLAEGNSEINISEAIASIQSSFVFQVKHTNKVYADFEDSSTCECEIQLLIHSKTSGNFSIQLEYNPPKNDITSTGPSTRASGQVSLGGKTTANLELQALQTETIKYNLNVAWPGVYNAAPKITVTDEERGVQESYSLHSPIIFAQALPSVSSSL